MKDDLVYYLKLHREAFAGPVGSDPVAELETPLDHSEKLIIAYQFLDDAKKRGEEIKFYDFKLITEYSSKFDEEGRCISDRDKYFHLDKNGKIRKDLFDEMIRAQVFKLLKYRGNFRSMITSKYFISPE